MLGAFVPAFGRVVAMMQFNMYHHYTVDEHLMRCIGVLTEIERGGNEEYSLANDLIRKIQPRHRELLRVDAVPARHRQGPHRGSFDRRRAHRAPILPAARLLGGGNRDSRLADREASRHVDGGAIARSLRPQDDREFRRHRAVAGAPEAPHHPHHRRYPRGRPRRLERLEGAVAAHALLRDRAGASPAASPRSTASGAWRWRRTNSAPR